MTAGGRESETNHAITRFASESETAAAFDWARLVRAFLRGPWHDHRFPRWTQRRLASRLGVSQTRISRLVNRTATLSADELVRLVRLSGQVFAVALAVASPVGVALRVPSADDSTSNQSGRVVPPDSLVVRGLTAFGLRVHALGVARRWHRRELRTRHVTWALNNDGARNFAPAPRVRA